MSDVIKVQFYGKEAQNNELDLYDAGRCIEGLGRTLNILGNFYESGKIITKAPASKVRVNLRPPLEGSFIIEVVAGATASIVSVPFVLYITQVCQRWLPGGSEQEKARIRRLEAQLKLQGEQIEGLQKIAENSAANLVLEENLRETNRFIIQHQKEHDIIRSIVSQSFMDIFRPIGRSADFAILRGNDPGEYVGTVDKDVVDQLDIELPDDNIETVVGIVESFSRNSKRGIAFSKELGRGFRFRYGTMGKLGKEDDFSWSQFRQEPVLMRGRFYRFFDGSIKRLEVYSVERFENL